METGKNVFTVEFEVGRIKEFEKKILALGECRAFLPAGFVSAGGTEQVNYDCGGYTSLAGYEFKDSKEMVDIMEKCVFALIDSGEHLVNPRKLKLTAETVFYSMDKKEVRIAYAPRASHAEKAQHVFMEFVESFKDDVKNAEMRNYLEETVNYIKRRNGSFFDIVDYISELRKEIYACE